MPMRRTVPAALAGLLGVVAAQAAGDAPSAALLERLLKIELRCASGMPPPPALPPRPDDSVVGTSRPASGITVGTGPRLAVDDGPAPMEIVVPNGRAAALRWAGPQAAWDLVFDAAFVAPPNGRPPRQAQAEPLVTMRLVRRVHALQVQPHWPGGARPVRVDLSLSAGDAAAGAPALRTVVDAPLDRWTPLARVQSPEGSPASAGCALELRVRLGP